MELTEDFLTEDFLLGGRVRFLQPAKGYRTALDPVLLAAFLPLKPGMHVCEFGTGSGAVMLCAAARVAGLVLTAIEPDDKLRAIAAKNFALNELVVALHAARVGDDALFDCVGPGQFDVVCFNPPFYDSTSFTPSPHATRNAAHELTVSLATWVAAAKRVLRGNGTLACIITPAQLPEVLGALGTGFGGIVIHPVHSKAGQIASRVLVRATLQNRAGMVINPPLVVHEADGAYTTAAQAILTGQKPV